MAIPSLHALIAKGDVLQVRTYLNDPTARSEGDINAFDQAGYTPLMRAVTLPVASVELVRTLLEHGANVHAEMPTEHGFNRSVMALALGSGDPAKVQLLLRHGADIHYRREHGYEALVDAVHGRDAFRDERLLDLLRVLIASGLNLDAVTSYQESGCRVLSRLGRFDAVGVLLDAGADPGQLRWTPLLRAVALGSLGEVEAAIDAGAALEDKDWWERTAWLLAIQTGNIDKTRLLREHGANTEARGRGEKPSLFYAIEGHHGPMLRWLLENGAFLAATDQFGSTPLMTAVGSGNVEAIDILLDAGARVDPQRNGQTALSFATTREIILRLLDAGADPKHLSTEGRRALLGLPPEPDESLLEVEISNEQFQAGKQRRFGHANPERFVVPFWQAMIRAGITSYQAAHRFDTPVKFQREAVWCAQRFGQSITFLPDGRIIQVAGEHEDHYDPDFCIYNDVFVHHPDGTIGIYGYPETVFPPTDFHTATLLGGFIYLIGSLGYPEARRYGKTPVYRLDIRSFQMEEVSTTGMMPGWIYGHVAVAQSANEIQISGGKIVTWDGSDEVHAENAKTFVLHTKENLWT